MTFSFDMKMFWHLISEQNEEKLNYIQSPEKNK